MHEIKPTTTKFTAEQMQLFRTQDANYIATKIAHERKVWAGQPGFRLPASQTLLTFLTFHPPTPRSSPLAGD